MNKCKLFLGSALLFFCVSNVFAYEESTHSILTQEAANRSVLNPNQPIGSTLLSDLGFGAWGDKIYTGSTGGDPRDILSIMGFGAFNEDDEYATRVFNHFFDPQFNNFAGRALHVDIPDPLLFPWVTYNIDVGNASPDWALEDRGDVTHIDLLHPDLGARSQIYSFRSGQQYLFNALTANTPQVRQANASMAFQSLGQIVHHIQDMAQPQHVRNDNHTHEVPLPFDYQLLAKSQWSFYERYTRDTVNDTLVAKYVTPNPYTIPTFPTARQFWYTEHVESPKVEHYIGMAEFTAQNFVSFGTQYQHQSPDGVNLVVRGNPNFRLPDQINSDDGTLKVIVQKDITTTFTDGSVRTGTYEFLKGNVVDEYPSKHATRDLLLAGVSILGAHVKQSTGLRVYPFTQNTAVYEDTYKVLFPRAVAFSAGLINHFFRGRIGLRKNPDPNLPKGWLIKNLTQQTMSGEFSIYAENTNGIRTLLSAITILVGPTDAEINLLVDPPTTTTKLIAVFRGQIGAEGNLASGYYAVAGKVISYTPPPPPPPPPSTCSGPYFVSVRDTGCTGCTTGWTYGIPAYFNLGSNKGVVQVRWKNVGGWSQQVSITSNNAGITLLTRTNISGTNNWTFDQVFDPVALKSTSVTVRPIYGPVPVGAPKGVDFAMSCPGQTLPQFDEGGGDAVPPIVTIDQPSSNTVVSGNIAIAATATDNVAVYGVQFVLDGQFLAAPITSPPYSTVIDTVSLANGSHTLTAYATDTSGNTAVSGDTVFTVNNQAPVGVATLISPSGMISSTTPTFMWNAVPGAITYILYYRDNFGVETYGNYSAVTIGCGAGTGTCSITPAAFTKGRSYNWYVLASNGTSNGAWSSPQSFSVLLGSNASLNSLVPSSGTLSPAFGSTISSYTLMVLMNVTSIAFTPTLVDATASVTVNGTPVASGSSSGAIALKVSSNPITVLVTAQNGTTTQPYTVNVVRAPNLVPLMMLLD